MSITRKNNDLSATLVYSGKVKTVTLNISQLEAFRRFENELITIEDGGFCTTTDTYTLISRNMTLKKSGRRLHLEWILFS